MAEIDFDELDKAVSSLMKDAGATKSTKRHTSKKSPSKTSTATHDSALEDNHEGHSKAEQVTKSSHATSHEADKPKEVAEESTSEKPAPRQSIATKRRGKFMDMKPSPVHMKGAGSSKSDVLHARVGVKLEPISESDESKTPEVDKSEIEVPEVEWPKSPESTESHGTNIEEPDREEPDIEDPDQERESDESVDSEPRVEDEDHAIAYPFIPDAKVEKRPLGAPLAVAEPEMSGVEPVEPTFDEAEFRSAGRTTILPKELHSSILEVEAHSMGESTIVDDSERVGTPEDDSYSKSTPEIKSHSIPPQYKVDKGQDALSDEPRGSIYDDGADHSGLDMHKKKSHWLVVIMIFLLLVIGAAGGAAVYLFQTGAL